MKFLSMFSGIEAASVAWKPLGWKASAVCEIDKFASAVLAHHYPDVPNLGNVEEADFDAIGPIDLAVFGSPCQSFSVAGKRLGLDDPRGNLALVGARTVYGKRPRWFVFENVPGLLSSDSGWDFGTLLAAFAGYPPGSVFEPPAGGWRNSGVVRQAARDGYSDERLTQIFSCRKALVSLARRAPEELPERCSEWPRTAREKIARGAA